MTLKKKALLSLIISTAIFIAFLVNTEISKKVEANIAQSDAMVATTTGSGAGFGSNIQNITYDCATTRGCGGVLGSVIFTTPTVGIVEFYDATTTNVNLRTGGIASSSLLIAHFPSGTGTSTVPINVRYRYGLIRVQTGTISTSTTTYRNNY